MQTVRILGVAGSPRKNGNTAKLVKKALEGCTSVPHVETEFYEMAGKKIHHCIGCLRCLKTGACAFKDDFQDFITRYMDADGVIWGSPVYHMAVPASMKAAIDRLGNSFINNFMKRGEEVPRLSKVCGVLTIGDSRYGGQDLVLSFLVNSSLLMNGVVVSGDTLLGNYIGATGWTGGPGRGISKDAVLKDEEGMKCVANLGKRVAEMTRIVRAGVSALEKELPGEYFYTWKEL
jgi:multimeric flavodoxin WrbA